MFEVRIWDGNKEMRWICATHKDVFCPFFATPLSNPYVRISGLLEKAGKK